MEKAYLLGLNMHNLQEITGVHYIEITAKCGYSRHAIYLM